MANKTIEEMKQRFGEAIGGQLIYGTGGNVRHGGSFSEGNEAAEQLKYAQNNKDIDALYERAVNYEIDQARLEEQRAYDRWVLEEQREYDSPLQQIARQRAAGINPDIASGNGGGVGGGSSAQMAHSEMQVSPSQSKFSNAYDNINTGIGIVNTAIGLVNAGNSLAGTITNAAINFNKLPMEKELISAQGTLANAQANNINKLTNGQATNLDLQNELLIQEKARNKMSIMQGTHNFIGELANGMFTPDSTDEEITTGLQSLGMDDVMIGDYKKGLKAYYTNPELQAKYKENQLRNTQAEVDREVYTREVLKATKLLGIKAQMQKDEAELARYELEEAVNETLMKSGYAQQNAEVTMQGLETQKLSNQEQQQKLTDAIKTNTALMTARENNLKEIDDEIAELEAKKKKQGKLKNGDEIRLQTLYKEKDAMETIHLEQTEQFRQLLMKIGATKAVDQVMVNDRGRIKTGKRRAREMQYVNNLFVGYTSGQIPINALEEGVIKWTNTACNVANTGANVAGAVKGK